MGKIIHIVFLFKILQGDVDVLVFCTKIDKVAQEFKYIMVYINRVVCTHHNLAVLRKS